jgi:hypothetical protein
VVKRNGNGPEDEDRNNTKPTNTRDSLRYHSAHLEHVAYEDVPIMAFGCALSHGPGSIDTKT